MKKPKTTFKPSPFGLPRERPKAESRGPIPDDWGISLKEAEYCEVLLKGHSLSRIGGRIESLINKVEGRLNQENKENESLFELRIAAEFKTDAENIESERPNLGNSTVDFFCKYAGQYWFIEAVSARESDSCKSEEEELIRLQKIIGEKVFNYRDNREVKFRIPLDNEINVIIVDMRGYNSGLSDPDDIREVSFGVTEEFPRHNINGAVIKGIFTDLSTEKLVAVQPLRAKIHYVIFTNEKFSNSRELEGDKIVFPRFGGMFSRCLIVRNDSLLCNKEHHFPFRL